LRPCRDSIESTRICSENTSSRRTRIDLVSPDNPLGLNITDPAARDDVWTQNQLNLPVGRPVIVHLSSKDVVHGFGCRR